MIHRRRRLLLIQKALLLHRKKQDLKKYSIALIKEYISRPSTVVLVEDLVLLLTT